jgi:hypothetical protein
MSDEKIVTIFEQQGLQLEGPLIPSLWKMALHHFQL